MTAAPLYWPHGLASLRVDDRVAIIELMDPAKRNALGVPMFESLRAVLTQVSAQAVDVRLGAVLLRGQGPAFCGGFDLAACNETPELLRTLVEQLSAAVQRLRALPIPVVAQVQGAALAGGCALLAGCDFVLVAPDAQLGYPVHRIGVSPAVNVPALLANMGPGRTREVAMGGAVLDGAQAVRAGLATRVAASAASLPEEARALCAQLCATGPLAVRATKAWLNELDGSLDAAKFEHAAEASAAAAEGDEFARLLRTFWAARERK